MKTVLMAAAPVSDPTDPAPRIPNAMVEIGGRPIITHVMDIFSHFRQRDFIIAAGTGAIGIKQFFANYDMLTHDLTVCIGAGRVELQPSPGVALTLSVVDSGSATASGGRLRRLRGRLGTETFLLSYGDALGNVDIDALLGFHRRHGKLATVTAVRPPARAGALDLRGDRVVDVRQELPAEDAWINGGFLVLEPEALDYVVDDDAPLEHGPMMQLALDGELMAYRHSGFWHPLDTVEDRRFLGACCKAEVPPWLSFPAAGSPRAETPAPFP